MHNCVTSQCIDTRVKGLMLHDVPVKEEGQYDFLRMHDGPALQPKERSNAFCFEKSPNETLIKGPH